jgi:hypothetical protein
LLPKSSKEYLKKLSPQRSLMKADLIRSQILIKKSNKNTIKNQQTAITGEARKVKHIGWLVMDEMELFLRAM